MPSKSNNTRAEDILAFNKVIVGVNHNVTGTILLGGQSTTPPQIVAVFTAAIQASTDLDAAKATYQQKLAAQKAAFATAHATTSSLKSYVVGAYGKENPIVTEFGWAVAKPPVKSVSVKAGAAEKSAATRLARHTLGPKQKSTIHGSVSTPEPATTAAVVTPPVTK